MTSTQPTTRQPNSNLLINDERNVMSDIRIRLADALRQHSMLDDRDWQKCECGAANYPEHVADVLLSLPGIYIVDTEATTNRRNP